MRTSINKGLNSAKILVKWFYFKIINNKMSDKLKFVTKRCK